MFVGRQDELGELHRVLNGTQPRFIRLYGRRRVGKTELLTRLLQTHPGLYLNVDEAEYEVQRRTLASQVASQTGLEPRFYSDWDGFLDDLEDTKAHLVVFDEFQNLIRTGHGLLSRLQSRWDSKWKRTGPSLVLCGSSVGMMQRLTRVPRAPLFGRITDDVHLRPLAYHEVRDLYPGLTEEDRVRRYAIFGGTPYYHDLSVNRSLDDALWETLVRPNAPLLNEPEDLLRSEFQDASRPNSILREIGLGAHALHDLESRVGVKHGGLSQHLAFLQHDMDLVLHEEPVLGKRRLGHYVLPDPFFRFFYRMICERRNTIEIGRGRQVLEQIRRDLESYVGLVFEEVVRDTLLVAKQVKGRSLEIQRIGRWWNRRGEEIDLVAEGTQEIWAGEVKWSGQPESRTLVDRLLEKIPRMEGLAGKKVRPFAVCRGGLLPEARSRLEQNGGFWMDLKNIESIFEDAKRAPLEGAGQPARHG